MSEPLDWPEGEWLVERLGKGAELRYRTPPFPWRPSWHLWTGDAYALLDLPIELVVEFWAWLGDDLAVRLIRGDQWITTISLTLATSAGSRPSAG